MKFSIIPPAWSPYLLSALRMVTAYLFMLHGSAKLLHIPYVEQVANVSLFSLFGVAGVLELGGGLLLLIGLFSRLVAFLLSGEMAFAYFMVHASGSTFLLPLLNGGEAAILFCFIFLYIAAAGAGPISVDAKRGYP